MASWEINMASFYFLPFLILKKKHLEVQRKKRTSQMFKDVLLINVANFPKLYFGGAG